jgi:hypothetical protein
MVRRSAPVGTPAIRSLLRRMGLGEAEINVYLALLTLKTARASALARTARESRSTCYFALQRLEALGLAARVKHNRILEFIAQHPRKLLSTLESREHEVLELKGLIEGVIPYLTSLNGMPVKEPRVTVTHGLEPMKQVYREIFCREFIGLFNAEQMYQIFPRGTVHAVYGRDVELRGRELLVDNAAGRRFCSRLSPHEDYAVRLLPPTIAFNVDITVFDDTITMFAYDEDFTIIRVDNQNIAQTLRTFFNFMWLVGRTPA